MTTRRARPLHNANLDAWVNGAVRLVSAHRVRLSCCPTRLLKMGERRNREAGGRASIRRAPGGDDRGVQARVPAQHAQFLTTRRHLHHHRQLSCKSTPCGGRSTSARPSWWRRARLTPGSSRPRGASGNEMMMVDDVIEWKKRAHTPASKYLTLDAHDGPAAPGLPCLCHCP